MRVLRGLLPLLLVAWGAGAAAPAVVPAPLAPWLDTAHDRVVERALVPSATNRVGEVRVVRRGEATVVQTLLYTKVLSRAVAAIRKKEQANWPQSAASARYVDELARAQKQIFSRLPTNERVVDRRQKLWIDFVVAPGGVAFVALGAFELSEANGEITVESREPLAVLELAPDYVRRNALLITADSFQLDEAAASRLLGPLP